MTSEIIFCDKLFLGRDLHYNRVFTVKACLLFASESSGNLRTRAIAHKPPTSCKLQLD